MVGSLATPATSDRGIFLLINLSKQVGGNEKAGAHG